MNPFQRDAPIFVSRALTLALSEPKGEDVFPGILFAALGFERLLKAILWSVNPTYTLIDTSFKNSAPAIYRERIKQVGSKSRDEVADKPNTDVLSFRAAVLRAGLFSKCVDGNRGTLLKLSHLRDVLAHCDLSSLDQADAREFFLGSIFPLVEEFANEGWIDLAKVSGGKTNQLSLIAVDNTPDLEARVARRLAHHRKVYTARKPEELERLENLPTPPHGYGTWYDEMTCPACGKMASVKFEVDFDVEDGHAVPIGTFVDKLACPYCDLSVSDYEELEVLGVTLDAFTNEDF